MTTTVQISGRAILGALQFAKDLGGVDGPNAVINSLSLRDREVFQSRIKAGRWYPYRVYSGLLRAIDQWPNHGRADPLRDLGQFGLGRDARSVLKILSIFTSVEGLVHRGFGAWGDFLWKRHCDAGEVFLADTGSHTASMGLRDFPGISPLHCRTICGYLEAMGETVGATSIRVSETRCVHRGDPHCEFSGTWD